MKKDRVGKERLLWWETAYLEKAIEQYKQRVTKALARFKKHPTTTTILQSYMRNPVKLDVHSESFQLLIDILSKDPFHPPNFEAKMAILNEDLQSGALFDRLT